MLSAPDVFIFPSYFGLYPEGESALRLSKIEPPDVVVVAPFAEKISRFSEKFYEHEIFEYNSSFEEVTPTKISF